MKSKRLKLKSISFDKPSSLPPKKTLEEKRTLTHPEDLRPARIKLAIKNLDPQTTLFPRKSLEKRKPVGRQKKSPYKSRQQKLEEIKQENLLINQKLLDEKRIAGSKRLKLISPKDNSDLVKSITKITMKDYDITKSIFPKGEKNKWLDFALNWLIDNNIKPIRDETLNRFINYWNSFKNANFVKIIKIAQKSHRYKFMKIALTYRLRKNKIDIQEGLSITNKFSDFARGYGFLANRKKIDPLNSFLVEYKNKKDWFNICMKPMEEIFPTVTGRSAKYMNTYKRILDGYKNNFCNGSDHILHEDVSTNYDVFVNFSDLIVSHHEIKYFYGITITPFINMFFEFLVKINTNWNGNMKLIIPKYLFNKNNLNTFYKDMRLNEPMYPYFGELKIVVEKMAAKEKLIEEENQMEFDKNNAEDIKYDRFHPEDNN